MSRGRTAAALALLALAGCGGEDEPHGALAWSGRPQLVVPENLPRDRIVTGSFRNDSLRPLRIEARDVRLVAASGRRVPGSAIFLKAFIHGLFPPTREPELSDRQLVREGRLAKLAPGQQAPLTVSWRAGGGEPPVRIETGAGSLPLP